jgi:hypothetical protein
MEVNGILNHLRLDNSGTTLHTGMLNGTDMYCDEDGDTSPRGPVGLETTLLLRGKGCIIESKDEAVI